MLKPHTRTMLSSIPSRLRTSHFLSPMMLSLIITLLASSAVRAATTIPVTDPNGLQSAINFASPGDEIVLDANKTYTGPITLVYKPCSFANQDDCYITIRTARIEEILPPGTRVDGEALGHTAAMAKINTTDKFVVTTEKPIEALSANWKPAHHYRFIGIEFMPASNSVEIVDFIRLGFRGEEGDGHRQKRMDMVPHHFIIDRCYIHGHKDVSIAKSRRGVALNSADTQILNSYISDFKLVGFDTQAICGMNGPGPFKIINNYLEATGENIMFGGSDVPIPGLVPSDIEIYANLFSKPIDKWRGKGFTIKNLLELKNAQRVKIHRNLFQNSWGEGQEGAAILFTTVNQEGDARQSVVQEVEFKNNIVRNTAMGILIKSGGPHLMPPNAYPTDRKTNHLMIINNLFYRIDGPALNGRGAFLLIDGENNDVTVDHNTVDQSEHIIQATGQASLRFKFTNNIARHNQFGVLGDGSSSGTTTLNTYFPGAEFRRNLIIGGQASSYPTDNTFILTIDQVGFYNRAAADYRIASTSPNRIVGTDGLIIGYAHPLESARTFVQQQYLDFLRRAPDAAGWDFWTDNINKCYDPARRPSGQTEVLCIDKQRETTSGAFFLSPEFQYTGYYIYRIYKGGLGKRPIKATEFVPDQAIVANGIIVNGQLSGSKINMNKQSFAEAFVNRPQFTALHNGLTNAQYVDKLFMRTGVTPTPDERNALITGLNNSTETRATVLFKIVDGINVISEGNQQFNTQYGKRFYDNEFNAAFVFMQYLGYLQRDPDEPGFNFWLSKLNHFGNYIDAEMVRSFIISPEYLSRFGAPDIGYVGHKPAVVLEQSSIETQREERLTWTNAVGVTVNGNSLTSTGSGWNTSGAVSTQSIISGEGYAEFTATETNAYRIFGLSNGDTNQNYADIDFALMAGADGVLYVYEAGIYRGSFGAYATGDRLRVAVEGGQIKYKRNGLSFYTSSGAPIYPLLMDVAFYTYGATVTNAVLVGRLDHGTAAGPVSFYTGFESGQRLPDWYNSADYITNVTGYCCGLASTESSPRQETARLGTTALLYSGYDTSAGGPSYSYNKVFDVNIPVTANTELTYWIYPQAVGGNNSAYVSIDLFCTDGSSVRDSGAVDQWGVRVHPAYQGAGGRLALNQWNLVRSRIGAQLAGKTIYRIYVAYDQPQNTGPYRGYIDDISIVERIP
jgi:hypothetical protein